MTWDHVGLAIGFHRVLRCMGIIILTVSSSVLWLLVSHSRVHAVAPITPSGLNTQVNLSASPPAGKTQYDITGGTRPGGGVNLFHSFGDFNVPTNNIANFLNDSGLATSNILARVTGANGNNPTLSSIYGTIQTTGFGNANLFLMNPAGFLFGPNATVNVGGMVAFTTADYLRLSDGTTNGYFYADSARPSLLTATPVAAFGFLGSNPGAITVQGSQFTVADGTGISLVGGNITIQSGTPDGGVAQPARLVAPNGKIQLASAATPGEFDAATLQALPNMDGASFTSFGSVSLAPGSNINVSGGNTVSIRGGQFVLSVNDAVLSTAASVGDPEAISLSPGSSIISSNAGPDPGADVQILASSLQMDGASVQSLTMGDGAGGNISIGGQTVNLNNGAQIVSSTLGSGVGGNISISVTDTVSISGFDATGALSGVTTTALLDPNTGLPVPVVTSGVFSTASGSGNGGQIGITAPTVNLSNVATIASITTGIGVPNQKGGDVQIAAGSLQMDGAFIQSTTIGDGSGGNISIGGQTVSLTNGAQIVSSTTGTGSGGNIAVDATESVSISGFDSNGTLNGVATPFFFNPNTGLPAVESGIYSLTSGTQTATGGAITITAPAVLLDNGAMAATITSGDGDGGNISINATTVNITGEAVLLSSAGLDFTTFNPNGSGRGGDISVFASASVNVSGINPDLGNFSQISSYTWNPAPNSGRGGNILISSPNVTLDNFGTVLTFTQGSGDGGNISISAQNLTLTGGTIFTDSEDVGTGGTIMLSASNALFVGNGFIQTFAGADGKGGAINITAGSATVEGGGQSGNIETGTFGPAPAGPLTVQVDTNLTVRDGGRIDSFGSPNGSSGNISITAGDTVTISGTGQLDTATTSRIGNPNSTGGPSGTVDIQADKFLLAGNSMVESGSLSQGGGGITIHANNSVTLSGGSRIRLDVRDADGGPINILASTIEIDQSSIRARSAGLGQSGPITLNTDTITISNGQVTSDSASASGRSGNVTVNAADKLSISGQFTDEFGIISPAGIFSQTYAGGPGGTVSVTSPTITVSNGGQVGTSTVFSGNAGSVTLNTNKLILSSGGQISSSSTIPVSALNIIPTGAAGTVMVQGQAGPGSRANSILIDGAGSGIFTTTQGTGAGGSINILAQSLTVQNGGAISAATSGTAPTATGGVITVNANQVQLNTGATLTTATSGPGDAGNILVKADTFSMNGGATITASSTGSGNAGSVTIEGTASPAQSVLIDGTGSKISTDTQGTGAGGNISVNANNVTISNGGALSATTSGTASSATGGTITVTAPNTVTMTGGATITADSTGAGAADAGNISITAMNGLSMQNSSITTQVTPNGTSSAGGGNITITTSPAATVYLQDSKISASVADGPGGGGNISIDPQFVILQNSQILAQAAKGQGGAITITAGLFLPDGSSVINADSGSGQNGTITIQSPIAPASGKILPLPQKPLIATTLLSQRCAALAGGNYSSFTVAGRDSLPTEPAGWLSSPLTALGEGTGRGARGERVDASTPGVGEEPETRSKGEGLSGSFGLSGFFGAKNETNQTNEINQTNEQPVVSLRRIAPPGFLTQAFAVDSAGCTS